MKTQGIRGLVIGVVLLSGACSNGGDSELRCETPTTASPAEIGGGINIRVGDSVTFQQGGRNLQLQFVAVDNDSRCPADAPCATENRAVLNMIGQLEGEEPRAFTLETDDDTTERFRYSLGENQGGGSYEIQLQSVEPAPATGRIIAQDRYCSAVTVALVYFDPVANPRQQSGRQ